MASSLELFKVERIDEWPGVAGAATVWIIRGETVEDHPRWLRLKTTDAWKAALCDRMLKAGQWVWITWMDAYRGDPWLRRCEPDTSKFQHSEAV